MKEPEGPFIAMSKALEEPSATTSTFLVNTFDIVNNSDPSIVAWVDNGNAFVIKDVDAFSKDIIPLYFKHRKFSSFVRQLNFYGFRKIKTGKVRLLPPPPLPPPPPAPPPPLHASVADVNAQTDSKHLAEEDKDTHDTDPPGHNACLAAGTERHRSTAYVESKYCKFRHEKFKRGRPDLLSTIRKSAGANADPDREASSDDAPVLSDQQTIHTLRSQVAWLQHETVQMRGDIAQLQWLLSNTLVTHPKENTSATSETNDSTVASVNGSGWARTADASASVPNVQLHRRSTTVAMSLAMGMTLGESFPQRNDNTIVDNRPCFHPQSHPQWLADTNAVSTAAAVAQIAAKAKTDESKGSMESLPDAALPEQAVNSQLQFHSAALTFPQQLATLTEQHLSSSPKQQNNARRHRTHSLDYGDTDDATNAPSYHHDESDRETANAASAWSSAPTTPLSPARYALTHSTPSLSSHNVLDRHMLQSLLSFDASDVRALPSEPLPPPLEESANNEDDDALIQSLFLDYCI